jgi:hypothetical protein
MKRLLAFCFALMALPCATAQTQAGSPADSIERSFAPGGKVTMTLAAGRYHIRPGNSNDRVRLHWSTIKPGEMSRSEVKLEIRGSEAVITARGSRDLRVEVEIPEPADLYVNLGNGDIDVRDIEGNKDITCHSGDVTIHGTPASYKQADLSVRLGDIEAPPFSVSKGGLLRSFQWRGNGKYILNLRTRMGSITVLER